MDTKKVEIKKFKISFNGSHFELVAEGLKEPLYLKIEQIIKMLNIENIDIKTFDEKLCIFEGIEFNKVILLAEKNSNGFIREKGYSDPYGEYEYDLLTVEIKS